MSEQKLSPVEIFKLESDYLRGDIAAELVNDSDHFGKSGIQLLKHHGTYQQDDRDLRGRKVDGVRLGKTHIMMVRSRIPGGKLTSEQLLAELDICDELGHSTLRVTSRQSLQLHGIPKSDLRETIRRINAAKLSTLAACGDVQRNVMCCPGPYSNKIYQEIQQLAVQLALHFAPRTRAYYELWLHDPDSGEQQLVGGMQPPDDEPIYGKQYLPRKFKTAIAFPFDNCIDIHTHDLGLLAIVRDHRIVGYNVLVGGGMGVTPSNKKTFPALSQAMAFVTPDQVLAVATAIVGVQRDFGDRGDRKVARLKYLIHRWGLEKFKTKVEQYFGSQLPTPEPDQVVGHHSHLGWQEQGDGKWFYGLNVENGRILDKDTLQLKSALREICRVFQPGIRLTAHQNILFTGLAPEAREEFEAIFRRHHVRLSEETSTVRQWSMACVAQPTCGLAVTESERALPGMLDQLEVELKRFELESEAFTVRMTGCPNGCTRPYNSDIGLVGKAKGRYTLFLGGRVEGDRLNFIYEDMVPAEQVVSTLIPLLDYYRQQREAGESFGDFCDRKGKDDLAAWAAKYEV